MTSPVQARVVFDEGQLVTGRDVTIYEMDGETVAQLYATDGVTPIDNPMNTNARGEMVFYVAPGVYFANPEGSGRHEMVTVGEVVLAGPPSTHEFSGEFNKNIDLELTGSITLYFDIEGLDDMFGLIYDEIRYVYPAIEDIDLIVPAIPRRYQYLELFDEINQPLSILYPEILSLDLFSTINT